MNVNDQNNPLLGDKRAIAERQAMNGWGVGCCCDSARSTAISIEFWWWAKAIGVALLIVCLAGIVLSV